MAYSISSRPSNRRCAAALVRTAAPGLLPKAGCSAEPNVLYCTVYCPLAGPTFIAGPAIISALEDEDVAPKPWASELVFQGTSQLKFNVTPTGNCSSLQTMPSISPAGVIDFKPAPDAFGQCGFSVRLCAAWLCSSTTTLDIQVVPGAAPAAAAAPVLL